MKRNFGQIVFDGYSKKSTKSSEINQMSLKHTSAEIVFKDMNFTTTQENFLSNVSNKQRFIFKLKNKLVD